MDNMKNIGDHVKKLYNKELQESTKRKVISSNRKTKFWLILIVAGIVHFIFGAYYFNRFVILQQLVKVKRGQIQKEFQRRNDLVPNLVDAAKDYMQHERELFRYVSAVRSTLESPEKLKEALKTLNKTKAKNALSKLIALAEQYPDLKATRSFQDLMDKLEDTENRIAAVREAYNISARNYNILVKTFPSNIFNIFFRFKEAPYFETEDTKVPKIRKETTNPAKAGLIHTKK